MLLGTIDQLGPWSWLVLGFVLIAAELVMPGIFVIWIGLGAIATGLLSLALWSSGFWVWEVQWLVFAGLSVVSIILGRRLVTSGNGGSDEPLLNQRTAAMIGRTAVLEEPIAEGRGRIRLGETVWPVNGPDLPPGTRVRIVSARSNSLNVEPV